MNAADKTSASRGRRLVGVVRRRSGDKTVAVEVSYTKRHSVYQKSIRQTKRYLVHDPNNSAHVGAHVVIQSSRPLSRRKRWIIVDNKQSA